MTKKEKKTDLEKKEEAIPVKEPIPEEGIEEEVEETVEKIAEEVPVERLGKEEMMKRRREEDKKRRQESWVPKTKLGRDVKEGRITSIDSIFEKSVPILEAEIVDKLIPDLQSDLIAIGQSKGKFGGGKRRAWRQTQKKTAEGNVPSFSTMAIVGDSNGHIGIGMGKAKETLPAREKAIRDAKLNLMKIRRGCGSFNCACAEKHSIPSKVQGKCGSARITLIPAPKGTGLAIEDECKKIMKIAGIKDIYSRTAGQTRTKFNLAKACVKALENTTKIKIK